MSLSRAMLRHRLGHAILLVGDGDDSKKAVAHYFAMMLLCEKSRIDFETIAPCEACSNCTQIKLQQHANVEWIVAEPNEEVRIDQVREVREHLRLSSFNDKPRLIVLANVNALTMQAANALLKSIEEPNVGQYFLLMGSSSSAMPRTLLSRCQRLMMATSSGAEATRNDLDVELAHFAEGLLTRIRQSDLSSRIGLVEEIVKHGCDKTHLLSEIQRKLHSELRKDATSKTCEQRKILLKSLEATEHSRLSLEHNANTQLTLEHWLLSAWPIELR